MSKPICLTEEIINEWVEDFKAKARSLKMTTGSFSYTRGVEYNSDDKVKIIFKPAAYVKMLTLLSEFSDEVAWHGIVDRCGDDQFVISDILVYPQEVSGATVNTDQEEYTKWLVSIPDDVFNRMHMQGHSHVNMACTPSSTDLTHQQAIVDQLHGDHFYIFMIWNKRLEHNIKVYDFRDNALYEDKDCIVSVEDDGLDLGEFVSGAKKIVKRRSFAPVTNAVYSGWDDKDDVYARYGYGRRPAYGVSSESKKEAAPKKSGDEKKKTAKNEAKKRTDTKKAELGVLDGRKTKPNTEVMSSKKILDKVADFDDFIYGK